ncbi:MAG: cofactor-independent phosphoglycerate mutase [Coriobacteriales bacterium]|nr:cofactor-independent phosphoglycerate mutase [Actinomycetes bacterium]
MKHVIVILDGAAGWPLPELDGRTTLEAAHTPHLDELARRGILGRAQTVPAGAEPSSSAACTSILGYDPVASFVGRGAIEAASMGVTLARDEVALRMNLVHVADGRMVSYACGHISSAESRAIVSDLASALDDGTFTMHPGVAYRHILVVKGHLELLGCGYTPPHDISDKPVEGHLPRGPGAELLLELMERARPVLASSPANRARAEAGKLPATDIWPFWPGMSPVGLRLFSEVRGVSAALTSGVDLLNGLAVLFGIDRLEIPGVTDGPDTDYAAQARGALDALQDHDLVVIHIESPDEQGHAGDVRGKIAAIEAIDREVVSRVMEHPGELRILAMPDHPTPIALKTHVGEPVPFVVAGAGVAPCGARAFDEAAAMAGPLVDPGHQVMDLLLGTERPFSAGKGGE